MTQTEARRAQIRELIESRRLGSQEEILEALAERGIRATQPVLSRDLRALSAAKRAGVYELGDGDVRPLEGLAEFLRSVALAGDHLVVVRTEAGAASAVGRAIDGAREDGVLGTVAGDDTVFVAVATAADGARVRAEVEEALGLTGSRGTESKWNRPSGGAR